MPVTNSRSLPSLKGVFPGVLPKPKRNFLRENKLKIRELQATKKDVLSNRGSAALIHRDKRNSVNSTSSGRSCPCPCNCKGDENQGLNENDLKPKSMSVVKVCDQQSQTEEIQDEDFLISSLKKCSTNDVVNSMPQVESDQDDQTVCDNFDNLDIGHPSPEQSYRSNATSKPTNRSKREVKLPRYLVKEKIEKEEQRLREEARDPNCPPGHYGLSEDERLNYLNTAEKKYQQLLNEFNRLPFATETLRLRSRKMEIEKNLGDLEADMKIFSKSKVYLRIP